MRITIFAGVPLGLILSLFGPGCNVDKTVSPPVKTETYSGTIGPVPISLLQNSPGTHKFILEFYSDGTFTMRDTISVPSMQFIVGATVETGTFSKSVTAYTLSPTSCADTMGNMSAANCTSPTQTATISGNTITVVAFFNGVDLAMTKQ